MGIAALKQCETLEGETYIIRTALPEDADQLIAFSKTVLGEAPYLLTMEAEFNATTKEQKHLLKKMYDDNGKLAILAEKDNGIIGFLDFHNGHRERIKHQGSFGMSVRKEFRNQGVGKALLSSLIHWAGSNPSIEKICLEVFESNKGAIHLYKRFGFLVEGRKSKGIKYSDGSYDDILLMALFPHL